MRALRLRLWRQGQAAELPGAESDVPVTRLLRVSRSRVLGSVMDELFAARERACGPLRVPGLCGALLHSSGWFVLWLEGPAASVDAALARSAGHACHEEPRVIHRSIGPRTLREPMTVTTTQWTESPALFGRRIEAVAAAEGGQEPLALWLALSEPSTLADGPVLPSQPPRRVVLVSCDDTGSLDVARKLAERLRRPVVYQRLAGPEPRTRDMGSAYLDIGASGRRVRLQVVARRALGHRMVREALQRAEGLALLLGAQQERALELAHSVHGVLAGRVLAPAMHLVGPCPHVAAAVAEILRVPGAGWPDAPFLGHPDGDAMDRLLVAHLLASQPA